MIICPIEDWLEVVSWFFTENDTYGWLIDDPLYLDDLQTFTSIWEAEVENSQV